MDSTQTDENYIVSPVYRALTRPITYMGVDIAWFGLEIIIVMLIFLWTRLLWSPLLLAPLHIVGMVLIKIDPYIFALINVKGKLGQVKFARLFGGQRYGD